VMTQKFIKLIN